MGDAPGILKEAQRQDEGCYGERYGLPLTALPFAFARWMGGDPNGNPNVTPDVTREVYLTN